MPEYKTLGVQALNQLIAGDFPLVTEAITVAAGQTLSRGSILGKVQSSGQYVLSKAAATDGSEKPIAILSEDIDSTNRLVESVCYLSGQFKTQGLIFGEGHTAESTKHNLRLLNIYLTNTI